MEMGDDVRFVTDGSRVGEGRFQRVWILPPKSELESRRSRVEMKHSRGSQSPSGPGWAFRRIWQSQDSC
jgi:hypothetical protein